MVVGITVSLHKVNTASIIVKQNNNNENFFLKKNHPIGLKSTNDFSDETVPTFRVCLLGIIRPLSFLTLPQTRLRLFSGREEFESFLRQTVLEAKDKVRVSENI